jgi:amino acid adenylation domain-containing protein
MEETEQGLAGSFGYNTDLFDAATIARMTGHFQTLLLGIAAHPKQRLSDLPLSAETELRQLLVEWNDTKAAYPKDECIHELFEEQAGKTPDAVAVVFEDQKLTYQDLNTRANQLAHHLVKLGVGPEVRVGICVERSLEMITGLLGILKAGGAYVPVSPALPRERLEYLLADSGMKLLLTRRKLEKSLSGLSVTCIFMDDGIAGETGNLSNAVSPEQLAYLIYTSGTTGKPKGVLIEHRQAVNYVEGVRPRLELNPGAGYAMVQPLMFDIGNTVLFPSLLTGGCLHVISEDRAIDGTVLKEYFQKHRIEFLKITPTHLRALGNSLFSNPASTRQCLIIGGEASRRDWIEELRASSPGCTIFNHYGPTETTVGVLMYRVEEAGGCPQTTLPLGRPLSNTRAYVLDRQLKPVPIGATGELYIGGDGLGRGYLNRPDQTAERFVPDPFSGGGNRLYRTGDLVRYLPDGNIEFRGRVDDQVKIRGFRIEPGEIEAALREHSAVRDAVVIAREDAQGDRRLVAYVVCREGHDFDIESLRMYAKKTLPDYMVPSAYVRLEAIPRTPHGKIDRNALPAPDRSRPGLEGSYAAPRTSVEEILSGIWSQVLGVERVGIHDNFFELGGHSLLATQVVSRVR